MNTLRNWLRECQEKIRQYLGAHRKTRIFTEYSCSIVVTLFSAFLFSLAYKIFQSPDVPHVLPIISGGAAGVARTIALIFDMSAGVKDTTLIYSISYAILNLPFIYLAFRYIGVRFAIFTTINVIATSLLTNFVSFPFIDELATHIACVVQLNVGDSVIYLQAGLLARVFLAGVANGIGSSLSFACGGSAGGVDTLSYYFSLRRSSNIGRYTMAINSVIFLLFASLSAANDVVDGMAASTAIANAILILLFVLIYSFIASIVVDAITRSNKKEQIQIITKQESLSKLLLANIPHGATIVRSKGAFTGEDRIIIYVIVSTFETRSVVDLVRKADPYSFINVTSIKQVYGRFSKRKIK